MVLQFIDSIKKYTKKINVIKTMIGVPGYFWYLTNSVFVWVKFHKCYHGSWPFQRGHDSTLFGLLLLWKRWPGWQFANCKETIHVYMRHQTIHWLVQIIACRLFGTKPLSEIMLTYYHWTLRTKFSEISTKIKYFCLNNMRLKMSSAEWRSFCFHLYVKS